MKLDTTRFGEIEIDEGHILRFRGGILGFPKNEQFTLIGSPSQGLLWLQAMEDPGLAFMVCDPTSFVPEYQVGIGPQDMEDLELKDFTQGMVLVILRVPDDPKERK